MMNMGYEKAELFFVGNNESGNPIHNWIPKSKLIYEAKEALERMKHEKS